MGLAIGTSIDVHQHLWPPALIEALRARSTSPRLHGWTLYLDGEPPYDVRPGDHDIEARRRRSDGGQSPGHDISRPFLALLSLSSPLGIEDLPADQANPLLEHWHAGLRELPAEFAGWAAVSRLEPDLAGLEALLTEGSVPDRPAGLQVPATWLATPEQLEKLAPVLAVCERADRPVLVHPGPATAAGTLTAGATTAGTTTASTTTAGATTASTAPGWWPAVVDYPSQLQAAWWSWHVCGRALFPSLRIGFVAGAGLAALHHERLHSRGGRFGPVDPGVFVETSSYGPRAIDALIQVLGLDAVIRGSDLPYAEPAQFGFGLAANQAIDVINPRRFLFGERA